MAKRLDERTRNNIVTLYREGAKKKQISDRLLVSLSSVATTIKLWEETGGVAPRPQRRGATRLISDEDLQFVAQILRLAPSTPVRQINELMELGVSDQTLRMAIRTRLVFSYKKKNMVADRRADADVIAAREAHVQQIGSVDPKLVYFVDEAGLHDGMVRNRGWGPRNSRLEEMAPDPRGTKVTIVSSIGLEGPIAPLMIEGSMNGQVYEKWVMDELLPALPDGAVVVQDNLSSHRTPDVVKAFKSAKERGITAVYLPPYSPDLNPIELAWSKLKWAVRCIKPVGYDAIVSAVATALDTITKNDIIGWYSHCKINYSNN